MRDHRFDPVTLEVIRNRLDVIAEEMQTTLLKSSCSPIVKEGLDASASLFTLDGTTLAQACAIPIHLATLIPAVAEIRRVFPIDTMREGDIYLLNDPYCGGTHLPDFAVVMPVFARGRPLALAATMTHHQDVGGLAAGSVPTNATEIYQEGLRIPAVRWATAGQFDATLTAVLRQNVRIPDIFMGDLHAQVAACKIAILRLKAAAEKWGENLLISTFGQLIDKAEAMTRAALAEIPPGTYRYVDWLDNDGIELDRRLRIEVAATVEGGDIRFDLTGTSAQTRGPVNCVPSGSLAAACFAVRAVTDPSIPNNGGCFRPISLTLPEGSLVNPRSPAPVNARTITIKRITGSMLAALAQAVPERVPAPAAGQLLVMAFGGRWRNGTAFVTGELLGGGSGAGNGFDGVDAIETDATNCMNLPAEAMELEAPIRVRRWSLNRDSGGPGTFRGGLGQIKEFEVLDDVDGTITFSHRGERHFVPAAGMAGGRSGACASSWIERATGEREDILSKLVCELNSGDRIVIATAGGGGWGQPLQRDRAAVAEDFANGKVSQAAAGQYHEEQPQTSGKPRMPRANEPKKETAMTLSKRNLVASAIQITAVDGEKDAAVEKMLQFLDIAGERNSDICVLPELWTGLGFSDETIYRQIAEPIPGPITDLLSEKARNYGMYIAGSMYEDAGGGAYYNCVPLIGSNGEILGKYRKTHLFDAPNRTDIPPGIMESMKVLAGGTLEVYGTNLARMGLSVCSDLRFPEVYREMALKGAEILICASAFLAPRYDHWEFFLRARATENQCFVVASGQYGREPKTGLGFVGRSMIVDPWGVVIATASDEEGVVTAHLDLDLVQTVRNRYPLLEQRRPELYGSITAQR